MTDKIIEKFRYEFGDNQPDIEEFIRKEFEEVVWKYSAENEKALEGQEKQHRKFQKALGEDFRTACEEMRLGEDKVRRIIRSNIRLVHYKKFDKPAVKIRGYGKASEQICQLQEGRGE